MITSLVGGDGSNLRIKTAEEVSGGVVETDIELTESLFSSLESYLFKGGKYRLRSTGDVLIF